MNLANTYEHTHELSSNKGAYLFKTYLKLPQKHLPRYKEPPWRCLKACKTPINHSSRLLQKYLEQPQNTWKDKVSQALETYTKIYNTIKNPDKKNLKNIQTSKENLKTICSHLNTQRTSTPLWKTDKPHQEHLPHTPHDPSNGRQKISNMLPITTVHPLDKFTWYVHHRVCFYTSLYCFIALASLPLPSMTLTSVCSLPGGALPLIHCESINKIQQNWKM